MHACSSSDDYDDDHCDEGVKGAISTNGAAEREQPSANTILAEQAVRDEFQKVGPLFFDEPAMLAIVLFVRLFKDNLCTPTPAHPLSLNMLSANGTLSTMRNYDTCATLSLVTGMTPGVPGEAMPTCLVLRSRLFCETVLLIVTEA